MGDRYVETRHANLEALLRRSAALDGRRPGIGHNGGPPLDLSWSGWLWRRAVSEAWKTPPREVVLQRLRRAGCLGLGYRDYTAVLLDRGSHLSTALLPLHYAASIRPVSRNDVDVLANPHLADPLARFGGRLLLLADAGLLGPLPPRRLRLLENRATACFEGKSVSLVALPNGPIPARAAALTRALTARGVPAAECFLLGLELADAELAQAAGLGCCLPLARWFADG
ncbi:MAG TPA: hypothetical protein VE631_03910 [Alphaproteobacteria bacterium]|nr:hypothetical protein [Alphaproteobacteria bacterium]